jgi:apolipoprotein N-acyltransferase
MEFVNKRNAAIMVGPQTPLYGAENEYAKHHLVVFGEYVPFKQSWPWLNNVLQMFTPYDYDYSLTPGAADQPPFAVGFGDGRTARFQVAICYEDAMPYRVRQMVRPTADAPGRKAVDFIANISNDGWFNGSVELDQHLNLCVFRAIENRVAVVRSVNTGISAIITPTGGITAVVETGGSRRNVCGQIVGPLTLDDRLAPYTLAGDWLAWACAAAAAAGVAAAVVRRRLLMRERRKEAAT